jgi:hypothetical protein
VVANSKERAEIIDRYARQVAMHPAVEQRFEPRFRELRGPGGSYLQVKSADAGRLLGLTPVPAWSSASAIGTSSRPRRARASTAFTPRGYGGYSLSEPLDAGQPPQLWAASLNYEYRESWLATTASSRCSAATAGYRVRRIVEWQRERALVPNRRPSPVIGGQPGPMPEHPRCGRCRSTSGFATREGSRVPYALQQEVAGSSPAPPTRRSTSLLKRRSEPPRA